MPDYIAVKCYSCGVFQVNQKTKSPKWQCKVCGEKQTLQKVYVIAPKANMIRPYVQDLNMKRGLAEMEAASTPLTLDLHNAASPQQPVAPVHPSESAWRQFDEAPRPVNSAIADLEEMAKEEALCATFGDLHEPSRLGSQQQQWSGHEHSRRGDSPHSNLAPGTFARPAPANSLAPWQRKRQLEADLPSQIPRSRIHTPVPPRAGIAVHLTPACAAPLASESRVASARSRVRVLPTRPSVAIAATPQLNIFATHATHAAPEPSVIQGVDGGPSSAQASTVSPGLSFAGLEEVPDAPVAAAQLAATTVLPCSFSAATPHEREPLSPAVYASLRVGAAPHAPRASAGSIYKRARPAASAGEAVVATARTSPARPSGGAPHACNEMGESLVSYSFLSSSSSSSSPASFPPTNIFATHTRAPATSPSAGARASLADGGGRVATGATRVPAEMWARAGAQEDRHSDAMFDVRTALKEQREGFGAAVGDADGRAQDVFRAAAGVMDRGELWGQRDAPAAPAAVTPPGAAGGLGDMSGAGAHVGGLSFMDVPDEEDEEDTNTGGDAEDAEGWGLAGAVPVDSIFLRTLAQSAQPSGANRTVSQPRDDAAAARGGDPTPTTSAWAAFL